MRNAGLPPFLFLRAAVRNCYLLHLCLEGEGVFYSGEERYPIKQGQGFLIHPGKLTFYQADSVNPWSYLWVGIGGHDAEKYLRLAGLSARNPIFSCTQIDTAKSYILDMMKHHALSAANEIYIQGIRDAVSRPSGGGRRMYGFSSAEYIQRIY